jgi:hypothetical protein
MVMLWSRSTTLTTTLTTTLEASASHLVLSPYTIGIALQSESGEVPGRYGVRFFYSSAQVPMRVCSIKQGGENGPQTV